MLIRQQQQSTKISWEKIFLKTDLVDKNIAIANGLWDFNLSVTKKKKRNLFYCKEVGTTTEITLLFKVPSSDIRDVKYGQSYQNKQGQ